MWNAGAADLTVAGALAKIRTEPFAIPEGVAYRMKATFRIQNDVVSGLRYLQLVKRSLLTVDKSDEMFGSYAPRETPYEKLCKQGRGGAIVTDEH